MKKGILLFIIVLTINFITKSQETYLMVSGGISNSLNKFADNDFANSASGYAKDGNNFNVEMAYYINQWFGFGANLRFSNMDFDSKVFNAYLQNKYINSYDSINFASGNYNLHNFLMGPYGKVDLGKHFSFFAKAFVGVLSTFRPDLKLYYRDYGGQVETLNTQGKLVAAFSWSFGAGTIIKLNNRIGFLIEADYTGANPKFDKIDYENLKIIKEKQIVRFSNYNAGLVLTF